MQNVERTGLCGSHTIDPCYLHSSQHACSLFLIAAVLSPSEFEHFLLSAKLCFLEDDSSSFRELGLRKVPDAAL